MQKTLKHILKTEVDPAFARRAEFILKRIDYHKSKRILDAGCGRGFYLRALSFFSFIKEIHGIDVNPQYLKAAGAQPHDKRISIQKASIYSLPFPDNYFDAVICSEILEHLSKESEALREVKRVLKKGGVLLISVPNHHFPFLWDPINWILMKVFRTHINKDIWWLAGIWADHVRLYKEGQLKDVIEKAEFQVRRLNKYIRWSWPFSHFLLYAIGKNLVERVGVKTFDRFNFKKNYYALILATLFGLPSRWERNLKGKTSVSLALEAVK